MSLLRRKLGELAAYSDKKLSQTQVEAILDELFGVEKNCQDLSLWEHAPLMLVATIDDGWGNGIAIIKKANEICGVEMVDLGLLVSPETIINECRKKEPDFLGLTVLQEQVRDDLAQISREIPEKTKIIAGGAAFLFEPELGEHVHYVAKNAIDYILFLLARCIKKEL